MKQTAQFLADRLSEMQREGRGYFSLNVTYRSNIFTLAAEAMLGDDDKLAEIELAAQALRLFVQDKPMCLTCDAQPDVDNIEAIASLLTAYIDTRHAVISPICADCITKYPHGPDLKRAIINQLREFFPNIHETVTHPEGHA